MSNLKLAFRKIKQPIFTSHHLMYDIISKDNFPTVSVCQSFPCFTDFDRTVSYVQVLFFFDSFKLEPFASLTQNKRCSGVKQTNTVNVTCKCCLTRVSSCMHISKEVLRFCMFDSFFCPSLIHSLI